MDKDYTLTVRLRPALFRRLSVYSRAIGMTYAGTVRCAIATMPGEGVDGLTELRTIRDRVQAKIDALEKRTP